MSALPRENLFPGDFTPSDLFLYTGWNARARSWMLTVRMKAINLKAPTFLKNRCVPPVFPDLAVITPTCLAIEPLLQYAHHDFLEKTESEKYNHRRKINTPEWGDILSYGIQYRVGNFIEETDCLVIRVVRHPRKHYPHNQSNLIKIDELAQNDSHDKAPLLSDRRMDVFHSYCDNVSLNFIIGYYTEQQKTEYFAVEGEEALIML